MIVPIEALFYLDVAKRAVDEVVSIGAIAGLGSGARLPARGPAEYLPTETLDAILVDELLSHPTPNPYPNPNPSPNPNPNPSPNPNQELASQNRLMDTRAQHGHREP